MKSHRSAAVALLALLLPLLLWLGYFNVVYAGQTLACMVPSALGGVLAYAAGAVAVGILAGLAVLARRPIGGAPLGRSYTVNLALLAAIGTCLVAAAALAVSSC